MPCPAPADMPTAADRLAPFHGRRDPERRRRRPPPVNPLPAVIHFVVMNS